MKSHIHVALKRCHAHYKTKTVILLEIFTFGLNIFFNLSTISFIKRFYFFYSWGKRFYIYVITSIMFCGFCLVLCKQTAC